MVTAWNNVSEEEQMQTKLIERIIKEKGQFVAINDATSSTADKTLQQKRDKRNQHGTMNFKSNGDRGSVKTKKILYVIFAKSALTFCDIVTQGKMRLEIIRILKT